MLFTSTDFIFYFLPAALFFYYAFFFSKIMQNVILLLSSLYFYAFGEPTFVYLMVLSIFVNYIFGLLIERNRSSMVICKSVLVFMSVYNLGLLFVFKYLTFALENLSLAVGGGITVPEIIRPIGISFFTFQAISYVVDVYLGESEAQKNPFYVGLYISFFPQLVAGPIVKYSHIQMQITKRRETWQKFSVGLCRFVSGLAKKVLIANQMAIIADQIYAMNAIGAVPMALAWLGAIAYGLQLFYDFSGYSDMAIGLALMFGFSLQENFNYPYIAKSITELWRRWHISLGLWFKNYLYIPLGGSKVKNKDRIIFNLFAVWMCTGIWHGAEWTFLLWGIWNFIFIVGEKLFSLQDHHGFPILRHLYTLTVFIFGLVLFRGENLENAGRMLGSMLGFGSGIWSNMVFMFLKEFWVFLILGIAFCTPVARRINEKMVKGKIPFGKTLEVLYPFGIVILFLITASYVIKGAYDPFIYFNF